jgi:hypothetical protein
VTLGRTLTYGIVVAVLLGLYGSSVLILGGLLPLQGDIAVAASTLAAAAIFGPLLRRVRARVDRRFNRARYDAAIVVDGFGTRLRHEVDLTALHDEVIEAVDRTVAPDGASLWLRPSPIEAVGVAPRQAGDGSQRDQQERPAGPAGLRGAEGRVGDEQHEQHPEQRPHRPAAPSPRQDPQSGEQRTTQHQTPAGRRRDLP